LVQELQDIPKPPNVLIEGKGHKLIMQRFNNNKIVHAGTTDIFLHLGVLLVLTDRVISA
jgi:hypothetical protein